MHHPWRLMKDGRKLTEALSLALISEMGIF